MLLFYCVVVVAVVEFFFMFRRFLAFVVVGSFDDVLLPFFACLTLFSAAFLLISLLTDDLNSLKDSMLNVDGGGKSSCLVYLIRFFLN